jgi:hypothetical protein
MGARGRAHMEKGNKPMRLVFFAVLAMASFGASADNAGVGKPLEIAAVTTQQAQIRDDVLAKRGRYKDMPASTRDELLSRQARLMKLLEGKKTADDLTLDQQTEAFNALEWIEAAINHAEDERMVCRREKQLGSTRTTRVCRTVAQEREARERARESLERQSVQMIR